MRGCTGFKRCQATTFRNINVFLPLSRERGNRSKLSIGFYVKVRRLDMLITKEQNMKLNRKIEKAFRWIRTYTSDTLAGSIRLCGKLRQQDSKNVLVYRIDDSTGL
jgi:hypothetical protein